MSPSIVLGEQIRKQDPQIHHAEPDSHFYRHFRAYRRKVLDSLELDRTGKKSILRSSPRLWLLDTVSRRCLRFLLDG